MSDTAIDRIIQYGTNAARLAFTPNPPATIKTLYIWYVTDDVPKMYIWNGATWVLINSGSSAVTLPSRCEGRLSLATGTPVTVTDLTAQSTVFWVPCDSSLTAITNGVITLWGGSALVDKSITEISIVLSGLTSGKNYDVFVDYNSGTPQLVLSAAWTNDTTRADALGTQYDSSRLETIIVKSGTSAYRWVGTIRTTGTTTTEDSGGITGTSQVGGKRFVWNTYNQVLRQLKVIDTTDGWTYNTDTIRQAHGASGNKVEYVTGIASQLVDAKVIANVNVGQNTVVAKAGVGVDSTSTLSGLVGGAFLSIVASATVVVPIVSAYQGYPGLGYHFLSWNEKGATGTTTLFLGDDGGDSSQSGLMATIWN